MYEFEVRVLNAAGSASVILPGPHTSVVDALKSARNVAVVGDTLEVWRDDDRVHNEIVRAI